MGLVANDLALLSVFTSGPNTIAPSATFELPDNTAYGTVEIGSTSTGYNGATCTTALQASNDPLALTTPGSAQWVTVPTCTQANATHADLSVFATGDNAATPGLVDLRPYRYVRSLGVNTVATPSANVGYLCRVRALKFTPGSVLSGTLTCTYTQGSDTFTPSAPIAVPADGIILGMQFHIVCADFNGATITARVEVSNDPNLAAGSWHTLTSATLAVTASGTGFAQGANASDKNALVVEGYRYFRISAAHTNATPNTNGTITGFWKLQRQGIGTAE